MGKITSQDCVTFIIENEVHGSTLKSWKRVNKHKEGSDIVRVFRSEYHKMDVTVYERDGVLSIGASEDVKVENPTLAKLKENKIKVSFGIKKSKGFSGRVIYALDDNGLEGGFDGEFDFYCGPEDEDGYLDDGYTEGFYDKLAELLSDIPDIDIGSSENSHTVYTVAGISAKDLWDVIVERLERSGVIKMEE